MHNSTPVFLLRGNPMDRGAWRIRGCKRVRLLDLETRQQLEFRGEAQDCRSRTGVTGLNFKSRTPHWLDSAASSDSEMPWKAAQMREGDSLKIIPFASPSDAIFPQGVEGPPGPLARRGAGEYEGPLTACLTQRREAGLLGPQSRDAGITLAPAFLAGPRGTDWP